MNLAGLQKEFMGHVLEEDRPLPDGWDARVAAGLAVYRNAYRARLIDALAETFPRTQQWLGKEMFDAAAAHHLIVHPPTSWTLDMAGDGFVETLAELFVGDLEVPDLAWLEWAMHLAFTALDTEPLDAAGFAAATAGFREDDWAGMRLAFTPSLHMRPVRSDCVTLWRALADLAPGAAPMLEATACCIVWREGLSPVCALVPREEGECLSTMRSGTAFGDICAMLAQVWSPEDAAAAAGAMLGQWLARGLVVDVI